MGGSDRRTVNRVAFLSGVALVLVSAVGAISSLVVIWQSQHQLNTAGGLFTGSGAVSLADRITMAMQFGGGYVLFSALVFAAGVALCLAATHLPDTVADPTVGPGDVPPPPPVVEVPLEVENLAWAPVAPRPDEDPLRP